jgi:hypothetical protein
MRAFEKFILFASLALAIYAAYTLVAGVVSGTLCYQSRCAHLGNPAESFDGFATMYGLVAVFGLVSAWRSNRNIRTLRARREVANGKP